uniref:Uncharacterized protein n=1 Tax=Tetranychus urticae TaxID=32264 RepID=T1L4N2_TETUR
MDDICQRSTNDKPDLISTIGGKCEYNSLEKLSGMTSQRQTFIDQTIIDAYRCAVLLRKYGIISALHIMLSNSTPRSSQTSSIFRGSLAIVLVASFKCFKAVSNPFCWNARLNQGFDKDFQCEPMRLESRHHNIFNCLQAMSTKHISMMAFLILSDNVSSILSTSTHSKSLVTIGNSSEIPKIIPDETWNSCLPRNQ